MLQRLLIGVVIVVGLALISNVSVVAEDVGTHEGLVVSVEGNRLTMTDKDGKNQHAHIVPADANITCDGKQVRRPGGLRSPILQGGLQDRLSAGRLHGFRG